MNENTRQIIKHLCGIILENDDYEKRRNSAIINATGAIFSGSVAVFSFWCISENKDPYLYSIPFALLAVVSSNLCWKRMDKCFDNISYAHTCKENIEKHTKELWSLRHYC